MLKQQHLNRQILAAVLATLPILAYADHNETIELGDIHVVSNPSTDNEPSARAQAGDTAQLLQEADGISLYRAGGVSSLPVIHGLADDRIRIKVDGMDLISSCANHMNPALSYLSPFNVDSIAVYAGISPVSLGGDSIAGTIVVNSEPASFSQDDTLKTQAVLNTFYHSNNDARGFNLNTSVANKVAYMRYTGSSVEANNYRAGGAFKPAGLAAVGRGKLAADEVGSTAYQAINHALAFGVHHDNHLLEFKLGLQNIPYQNFANQRMDMTDNDAQQYQLKYEGQYDWGKLKARAYHERTRHSMNFGDDKQFFYGNAPGMPMETEGKTSGLSLVGDVVLSPRDTLRVGTELQRYRLNDWWPASGDDMMMMMSPNTFTNINNGKRDRYDVFAEWDAQWDAQWFTQVGARASQVQTSAGRVQGYNPTTMGMAAYGVAATAFNALDRDETDQNLDVTLLARFTPEATHSYQWGYAMKTRTPNLYERYTWANTNSMVTNMNNWIGDGNGYVGNVDLNPEIAHTVSATGEWHDAAKQDWQLKVTPYFTYVDNYIDAVNCATVGKVCPSRTDGFVNLSLDNQSARLYGLDMLAKKKLQAFSAWGVFTMTASLNYLRGKNMTTHDDLYNIMPLHTKLGVENAYQQWKSRLELKLVDSKDRVQAIRQENQTAGYGLVNFYTSYDWRHAKLTLGVENVLDKAYEDPLGGAYLGQGATMGTGVVQGVQVPGLGRSVNVGLTFYH